MPALFTYGTLQRTDVQLQLFHRRLVGVQDTLEGYVVVQLPATEADGTDLLGLTEYPILRRSDTPGNRVEGIVFQLDDAELDIADCYEGDDYRRAEVRLESGRTAWTYIDAELP